MRVEKSFTLLELVVVIMIIGILATLSISHYGTIRERAFDKEAIASLMLIQAAGKIYRMEAGFYYPFDGAPKDTAAINQYLKVSLPAGANRKWDYSIPVVDNGTAEAKRTGKVVRTWTLGISGEEPECTSGCP